MLYTGFCWEREEKNHLEDPGLNEKFILKRISKKCYVGTWTGLSWLLIATGGGLLRKR